MRVCDKSLRKKIKKNKKKLNRGKLLNHVTQHHTITIMERINAANYDQFKEESKPHREFNLKETQIMRLTLCMVDKNAANS